MNYIGFMIVYFSLVIVSFVVFVTLMGALMYIDDHYPIMFFVIMLILSGKLGYLLRYFE